MPWVSGIFFERCPSQQNMIYWEFGAAETMPEGLQCRGSGDLSESDQWSLSWIAAQLGAAQSRRFFVLVAGLGHVRSDAPDRDDILQQQPTLDLAARAVIEQHGGRIGVSASPSTLGYWPCFGLEQWHRARAAAAQIVACSGSNPVASVALHAGQLICEQLTCEPGQPKATAKQNLAGLVVLDARRHQMAMAPGEVWHSNQFQKFASDWRLDDEPDRSPPIPEPHPKRHTLQCYSGLADPGWTERPHGETAKRDRLLARLDELSVVVKAASVLGCSFQLHELANLLRMTEMALQPLLGTLCCADVFVSSSASALTDHYRFQDAKLCDVAYSHLPGPKRTGLHRRARDTLRDLNNSGARSLQTCCRIADHCERSGDLAEAARWLSIAGQVAVRTNQTASAISILQIAVAKLQDAATPSAERELVSMSHLLATQLAMAKGNAAPSVRQAYGQQRKRCVWLRQQDVTSDFDALWGSMRCHLTSGHLSTAHRLAQHLLHIAEQGTDIHRMLAHRLAGQAEFLRGHPAAACFHFTRVITLYEPAQHALLRFQYGSDQLTLAYAHRAWAHAMCGEKAAALHDSRSAFIQARRLNHPHTLAHALGVLALVHEILNERVTAKIYCMTSAALADMHQFRYWRAWSGIVQNALVIDQQPEAAAADILQADQMYRSTGAVQICGYAYSKVASAYLLAEDIETAEEFANHGIKHSHRTGIAVDLPALQLVLSKCRGYRMDRKHLAPHMNGNRDRA